MEHTSIIERQAVTLESLLSSLPNLFNDSISQERLTTIINNGFFNPSEDEEFGYWFARFITIRSNLWFIVDTSINNANSIDSLIDDYDYQYFVLGYAAVCSLIRMDSFLIKKVANHSLIQRKLNEAVPEHRIERKQFTKIHKALVHPNNAIRIHQAHKILKRKRHIIQTAVRNSPAEDAFKQLPKLERYLNLSRRNYVMAWLRSRKHNWRRRGASAKQKSIFTVLEYSGRITAELTLPRPKKVTDAIRDELKKVVQPGDIFITRHSRAMTNLFLPGFWPHAALYVGYNDAETSNQKQWSNKLCTFEALKDGVHFRQLDETLNVDAFVIIRPNLTESDKQNAINRVIVHAGKSYNFDFDFFRSDQLVCTEIIYRAYDGINNQSIPLKERMGRKTLSAEDLLDFALDTDWAKVITIFGVGKDKNKLIYNADAIKALEESYRK